MSLDDATFVKMSGPFVLREGALYFRRKIRFLGFTWRMLQVAIGGGITRIAGPLRGSREISICSSFEGGVFDGVF